MGVAHGGTGASSLTTNGVLIGNGTSAVTAVDQSTKGHILIGDGSGNPQMLAVGNNDQVLTADSGETTGVKWADASGGGGVSTCRFMVTNSSTISCSHGTWTKATWNAEVFDVGGNFASDKFTAPSDGTYMFTASLAWTTMVAGSAFAMGVYKNGSYNLTVESQSTEINISFMMNATWIMVLEADDYIELYAIQGSGSTESIGSSSPNWTGPTAANSNWWQGWLIG